MGKKVEPDNNAGLSMRQKHQDLLSVTRKLVVPAKYRALTEMAHFIDQSMNFLKSRMGSNEAFVSFKEVCGSIAKSHRKTCTLVQLR